MNELFSIAGKVAVITGAGGVLGGNIAQHFVQQGAKVVAIDIRQEQLDNRVAELKQYGQDVIGIMGNTYMTQPGMFDSMERHIRTAIMWMRS